MRKIAGLDVIEVGAEYPPRIVLVVLHGHSMRAGDLAPFGFSMRIPAVYYFPEGPVEWPDGTRSWWRLDEKRRAEQLSAGPRDLFEEMPNGLDAAREILLKLVSEIRAAHPGLPLVLAGFSQGGMLSCDAVLRSDARPDALILLSSSRIAYALWEPCLHRVRGLPVFVSHGQADDDLSFAAGENLKTVLQQAQAEVTWQPFEGGHTIPLVVWREVRKFLRRHFRLDGSS